MQPERVESAREDRATWLGDHDPSAPQTVQPSSVEQHCGSQLTSLGVADSTLPAIKQCADLPLHSINYHD